MKRKKVRINQVLNLVSQSGSTGITPAEIRKTLQLGLAHERCVVAHALTKLHKSGQIIRIQATDVHFNSFRYFTKDNTMTFVTAKSVCLQIIKEQPNLTASQITKIAATKINREIKSPSALMLELYRNGKINRQIHRSEQTGQVYYTYTIPDTTKPTPVQKPLSLIDSDSAIKINTPKISVKASTAPNPVFAIFSDGRALIEHNSQRIELSQLQASQLRNMLNSATSPTQI